MPRALSLVVLVLGCGGGATTATPPATADNELKVPELHSLDASAPIPPATAPSAHVDADGCRLEGAVRLNVRLSYDARDPAATFGQITDVDVTLVFGKKTREPSSVVANVLGLALDAQVPEDGVVLHARAPLGLSGIYDPDESTKLHWRLTEEGLIVRAEVETDIKPLVPLEAKADCAAIALEARKYPPRSVPKELYSAVTTIAVGIAASPGGPPVAELKRDAPISVIEETTGHRRVMTEQRGLWIGWVPSTAVQKRAVGAGYGYGGGTGRSGPRTFDGGHVCSEPLPLYVRKTGAETPLARIGNVRPNERVAFAPAPTSGTFRPLLDEQRAHSRDRSIIHIDDGFELVVQRDAAASCTPTPQ